MTELLYGIGGLIGASLIVLFIWGLSLPETITTNRTTILKSDKDKIFTLVTDPKKQSLWRSDVQSVNVSSDGKSWTEVTKQNIEIDFEEIEKSDDTYIIKYTSNQNFSGHWRGVFKEHTDGTEIQITETIQTHSFLARIMMRIFAPAGSHTDLYLADLAAAFET